MCPSCSSRRSDTSRKGTIRRQTRRACEIRCPTVSSSNASWVGWTRGGRWNSSPRNGGECLAEEIVSLTKGSRYRIESMETRERTKVTKGVFRGYATIGTDDAIVIELDDSHQELKGKLRLIPLHVVLAVDVLEHVPGDAPKVEKHGTMYG